GQKPAEGYNIQQMLEILTAQNVPVKLCKTCADGRGITPLPLIRASAILRAENVKFLTFLFPGAEQSIKKRVRLRPGAQPKNAKL
ncbi:DsrE family protein, partial [Salmonella enterica subsp. enterica serovar Kentucky]|nr:DsrE family protein [Salmonella enterica subsp. enterica serovar Kentucky]